jgi:hypothetical protein
MANEVGVLDVKAVNRFGYLFVGSGDPVGFSVVDLVGKANDLELLVADVMLGCVGFKSIVFTVVGLEVEGDEVRGFFRLLSCSFFISSRVN